jgi:hypothetical protein
MVFAKRFTGPNLLAEFQIYKFFASVMSAQLEILSLEDVVEIWNKNFPSKISNNNSK